MPATIAHAYFSKDVFDILPSNIKNKIDCSRIKMFGQSMDSLMFYLVKILENFLVHFITKNLKNILLT